MRVSLLVVSMFFVAGCMGPVDKVVEPDDPVLPGVLSTIGQLHRPGGIPVDVEDVVPAIGGQYSTGLDSTEPTIGIDAKGTVFMTAFGKGVRGSAPVLAMSIDQGQSWKAINPDVLGTNTHVTTFDPYVHVDVDTGRVFMNDLTPPCSLLSWTDNHGESWTTNPVACGTLQLNDHQSIVTAKPRVLTTVGYPNLVYFCANQVTYTGCAVSVNGGLTFLPQVVVTSGAGGSAGNMATGTGCWAITGHVMADHEGRAFLGFPCDADASYPGLAYTENDGATWNIVRISNDVKMDGHEVDFAVDEANNVYAVWNGRDDGHVWMSRSTDHLRTWSKPIDVTAPGVTATMFAAVAAGAPGKIAISYVGTTIKGGYEGKTMGTGGPVGDILGEPDPPEWAEANWNAYLTTSSDALTDDPLLQSATANDASDPLARGLCGRTRCHGMNDFLDVQIDQEGRPWASFVDVCTKKCVTDPKVHFDDAIGFAATFVTGPALRGDAPVLATIAPPPVPGKTA